MSNRFALFAILLAAMHSTVAPALPPSAPGEFDAFFGSGGVVIADKPAVDSTLNYYRALLISGERYYAVGYGDFGGATGGVVDVVTKSGQHDPALGSLVIPNARFFGVQTVDPYLVVFGKLGDQAALMVRDAATLAPKPGCGDASGIIRIQGPPGSTSNFPGAFPVDAHRVGGTIVFSTASGIQGGAMIFDVTTCAPDPSFGTSGFLTEPYFFAAGASWSPQGLTIGGNYKPPGRANQSAAVIGVDQTGKQNLCGGVKDLDAESGLDIFLNAMTCDAVEDTCTWGGYGAPANTPRLRRFRRSTCGDIPANYAWPGQGFVSALADVPPFGDDPASLVAAMNDFTGSPYVTRVVRYPRGGGAPSIFRPLHGNVPPPYDPQSRQVKLKAGALTIASSVGYAVAVDADAKIVLAGTADPAGGSALLARYIGVESVGNVIEFYNTDLNHYFITANPAEAAAVDGGAAGPGWSRTGYTWRSGGPDRVCRFYGTPDLNPATGMRWGPNGHFYTISSAECAAVKLDPGWHFESYDFSGWPLLSNGTCPAGTIAVKRAYNRRFAQNDSNHRYTTDDAVYAQMVGMGWNGEGTVFCAIQ